MAQIWLLNISGIIGWIIDTKGGNIFYENCHIMYFQSSFERNWKYENKKAFVFIALGNHAEIRRTDQIRAVLWTSAGSLVGRNSGRGVIIILLI